MSTVKFFPPQTKVCSTQNFNRALVDGCVTSCSPREDGNFNFVIEQMPRKKQSRIDNVEKSLNLNKELIKDMYLKDYLSIVNFIKARIGA